MTFTQQRNRLTTHFSDRIPVVKRRATVSHCYACYLTMLLKPTVQPTEAPTVRDSMPCLGMEFQTASPLVIDVRHVTGKANKTFAH